MDETTPMQTDTQQPAEEDLPYQMEIDILEVYQTDLEKLNKSRPLDIHKIRRYEALVRSTCNKLKTKATDNPVAKKLIKKAEKVCEITRFGIDMSESSTSAETQVTTKPGGGRTQLNFTWTPTIFDGEPRSWAAWWDTFNSTIHSNPDLDKHQKMDCLLKCLNDKAKSIIQSLIKTGEHYETAIKRLDERCANKVVLAQTYYAEMEALKPAHSLHEQRFNLDRLKSIVKNLESLASEVAMENQRVIGLIARKFPLNDLTEAIKTISSTKPDYNYTVDDLTSSLEKLIKDKEHAASFYVADRAQDVTKATPILTTAARKRSYTGERGVSCIFCTGTHISNACKRYNTLGARKQALQKMNRCFSCMKRGHLANRCTLRLRCKECNGPHHTFLCVGGKKGGNAHPNKRGKISEIIFLQTFSCTVKELKNNKGVNVRGLLDGGSTYSYINKSLVRKLGYPLGKAHTLQYLRFSEESTVSHQSNEVEVTLTNASQGTLTMRMFTTHCVVGNIKTSPPVSITREILDQKLYYADYDIFKDQQRPLQILVGADNYNKLVYLTQVKELQSGLYLLNSFFGWIPSGSESQIGSRQVVPTHSKRSNLIVAKTQINEQNDMNNCDCDHTFDLSKIEQLWSLEILGIESPATHIDTDCALDQFRKSTFAEQDGRINVRFPWKNTRVYFSSNIRVATARLKSTVEKASTSLLKRVHAQFQSQLREGIIEKVPYHNFDVKRTDLRIHYLPHRWLIQKDKLRIVYDASSKTKGGVSLNDLIHTGPNLIKNLAKILLNFRLHKIGLLADIEKAFLQISLNEVDRDAVRFLWLKDPFKPMVSANLEHLRLSRVPFGVNASPYLLNMVLTETLKREPKNKWLLQCQQDFYVDNFVKSVPSKMEAMNIYESLTNRLQSIKMNLRDWVTNDKVVKLALQNEVASQEHVKAAFCCDPNEATSNRHPNEATSNRHPNEASSNRHPNEATFIRHPNEATSNRHPNEATSNRHPNEATFNRHPNEATFIRHPNEATFNRHPNEATYIRHPNEATFIRHPNEATFIRHPNEATFIRHPNEATFIRHPNEATSIRHPKEATFICHSPEVAIHENVSAACSHEKEGKDDKVSVLGLLWNVNKDTLMIKFTEVNTKVGTKRNLLKMCASIFDPLGLVTPGVLQLKLLIQTCWKLKYDWDSQLPSEQSAVWSQIYNELLPLRDIVIPRRCCSGKEHCCYFLHVFCDASQDAYAACAYLVSYNKYTLEKTSNLIYAKARITPIRTTRMTHDKLTIPKLELLALVIGKRMAITLLADLSIEIQETILWTDATTVLHWLHSSEILLPFISNRIEEIKRDSNFTVKYVPSDHNPADIASRGLSAKKLQNNSLWWKGPKWLVQKKMWPMPPMDVLEYETENLIKTTILLIGDKNEKPSLIDSIETNWSSWRTQVKIMRYVVTFYTRCRGQYLTSVEIEKKAELHLFKEVQKKYYDMYLVPLNNGKPVKNNLDLFLDEQGLIRCKGRLHYAQFPYEVTHPILMPRKSNITYNYIKYIHESNMHIGTSHVLAKIREKIWVVKARAKVRSVIHRCYFCKLCEGGSYQLPDIPPLPAVRLQKTVPFLQIGLDYFGPLRLKDAHNEPLDTYVLIFACLVTRAIHLELVPDLSGEHFLMAIKRAAALKFCPKLIISDNAKTFEFIQPMLGRRIHYRDHRIREYFNSNYIEWHFIPKYAPWVGGAYERLIGLVKRSLKKSYGHKLLTYIECQTVLYEVADIINSRPLTYVSTADRVEALTPNHLLKLGPTNVNMFIEPHEKPMQSDTGSKLIKNWEFRRGVLSAYWEAFRHLYLLSLRERHTVKHPEKKGTVLVPPAVGDVVLIEQIGTPRGSWNIGRIEKLDKRQAVAHVRSKNEIIIRSIRQLYPLIRMKGSEPE